MITVIIITKKKLDKIKEILYTYIAELI